ncbi:MAG: hypothetical protein IJB42_00180 [Oscillospiraceae bacterium]|nr:hypothetical protein [Oscillospiraceae bacterium]MBQ4316445.1 hypothetical protein [Oscillospiraceae bacterium]MBQ7055048.1 hypothetical protein [Oscillospiraceae bacterium]
MDNKYDTNYTKEDIEEIVDIIHECVNNNMYSISLNLNRKENIDFVAEYNITKEKQKKILLDMSAEDFCYSVQNEHPAFSYEILYVFAPQVLLRDVTDEEAIVDVYVKINILENNERIIVVSFHKRNYDINYLFR